MNNPFSCNTSPTGITTSHLASDLKIKPQSIVKRLSQTGSYFNVRPVKLPNGRLDWPSDSYSTLRSGGK
jgi:hypothetical protein